MSIARRVFASGIARRTLVCFIVAALLPLAMTAILSLDQVSSLLIEQSHARLARAGGDYANALHERLLTVAERLKDWSSRDVGGSRREADRTKLQREFKAIGIVDASGRVVSAIGGIEGAPALDAAQMDRLGRGGTIVTSVAGAERDDATVRIGSARFHARGAACRSRDRSGVPVGATGRSVDPDRHLHQRREGQRLLLHVGCRADRAAALRVTDAGGRLRPRLVRPGRDRLHRESPSARARTRDRRSRLVGRRDPADAGRARADCGARVHRSSPWPPSRH